MSSALTVTLFAWRDAATASIAILSAMSKTASLTDFTADTETLSAPAFLAIFSRGASGNVLTMFTPLISGKILEDEYLSVRRLEFGFP